MKTSRGVKMKPLSAEQQLKGLIAKFEPESQTLIRSVRNALRKRFSSANELVYDYATSFVIGFSPTERGSDSVVAMSSRTDGLRLYFNQGPTLPDPKKILLGSGKQTRFIPIESTGTLRRPEVEALLNMAVNRATIPFRPDGRGKPLIKPGPAKRRPGRKPKR